MGELSSWDIHILSEIQKYKLFEGCLIWLYGQVMASPQAKMSLQFTSFSPHLT